jgi:hypothetical protein
LLEKYQRIQTTAVEGEVVAELKQKKKQAVKSLKTSRLIFVGEA